VAKEQLKRRSGGNDHLSCRTEDLRVIRYFSVKLQPNVPKASMSAALGHLYIDAVVWIYNKCS
jgi:hypothetical protein